MSAAQRKLDELAVRNQLDAELEAACVRWGTTWERYREIEHKRGFDSGVEHQKKADPPPMAKALKKELDAVRSAARAYLNAQTSDVVSVRTHARERLLAALLGAP